MLKVVIRKARTLFFYKTPLGEAYTKIYDLRHHLKYSFNERSLEDDKEHLKYYLTKHYHIIEKGLSLPKPRLGFGQPKIIDIIKKTEEYERKYGKDEMVLSIRKTLLDYLVFNKGNNFEFPESFSLIINEFVNKGSEDGNGGLKYISKNSSSILNLKEFNDFAKSRVSVRNFSKEPVLDEVLYSIVDTAKSAPSVCNRQGWKVHYYNNKLDIKKILLHQNGNAGFADVVDKLIIVTADAKAFTIYESNQVFIDGGLFSMNLLLAIHAAGLGACPLNTCYPYFLEKNVKYVADIPDSERLIMMIAVGCLKQDYAVAYSARNPTSDIFVSH